MQRRPPSLPAAVLAYCAVVVCSHRFADVLAKTSWGDKSRRHFLSREEEYVGGLKAALGIWWVVLLLPLRGGV